LIRTLVGLTLAVTATLAVTSSATAAASCHAWPSTYASTENAKAGGDGWHATYPTSRTTAQFWLDAPSAACGEQVGVHLAASGTTHFDLWRLGWYHGARGRLVRSWNARPSVDLAAPAQPPASGDSTSSNPPNVSDLPSRTTPPGSLASADGAPAPIDPYPTFAAASAAAWPTSTSLRITQDMPPGVYLLQGTGPDGVTTGAPLIVRDDLGPHALTVVEPTLTWQAYNPWGTANLYSWPDSTGAASGAAEADVVTFDRPSLNVWAPNQVLGQEKPLNQLANRDGLDVNWVASQDLQQPKQELYSTRAVVMSRHDEYWTSEMRTTTVGLVNRGINLINLGANNMYHAGRFLDAGMRWYQVRKGHNALHQNDDAYPISWRFVDSYVDNPQARLIGENFNCISDWVPFVVGDPTFWAWSAQRLRKGRSFRNIVGSESDGPLMGYPARTIFGSLSPLHCTYAGADRVAGTSYRVAPSHAGILSVGSMNWLCNLTIATCGDYPPSTANGRLFVTRTTETILREAAKGPLGLRHRAVGGVKPPVPPTYSRTIR
jgi:hypothetical protein